MKQLPLLDWIKKGGTMTTGGSQLNVFLTF